MGNYQLHKFGKFNITVMSHECQGIPNQHQPNYSFNNSFRKQRKYQSFALLALCGRNFPETYGHLSEKARNAESVSMSVMDDMEVVTGINSLRADFFSEEHIHVFTISIIPPHWHDTGYWNPFSCKTRSYLFYIVSIMGADALATQGARATTTMILTKLNWDNSVPRR